MRASLLVLTILAAPVAAQQPAAPPTPPEFPPPGWTVRLDDKDSTKTPADTKFQKMGTGFHVTSGPAALYYTQKDVATGQYTVRASFGQRVAPGMGHPEGMGVFIGGTQLNDPKQQGYLYFLVRGDGQFYIAHRYGSEVHGIVPWTANPAVKAQSETGSMSNEVAIQVAADSVHFLVNAQRVKSFATSEMKGFNTNGQYGLRVNHFLNVHISNFGVTK